MNILFSLPLILFFAACSPDREAPITSTKPHYTVTVNEKNIRQLFVEAILPLSNDTLVMSQAADEPLKRGYAEFVQDLKAFDAQGEPLTVTYVSKSTWRVDAKAPAAVRLKYQVNIDHDNIDWDVSSAFARSYVVDNALLFVGRVVFITPNRLQSAIEVDFNLPPGWDIATPFKELPGKQNSFEAKDRGQLLHNANFAGNFVKKEIEVGKLQVEIVGTPALRESVTLFHDAMESIVTTYESQMGGAPAGKLVIMAALSPSLSQGGETFPNSISLMLNSVPGMSNKSYWGYLLSHEIYHLWNGHSIRPAKQSEVEWFVEGFTEYMSKLTALRTGFISDRDFQQELASARNMYESLAGDISLTEAGREKGKNYSFIYGGGMFIASALDAEIKNATKTKGITDFMRTMYDKYGKTGKEYTLEDIMQTAGEVAGKDMRSFFGDYVAGTKVFVMK